MSDTQLLAALSGPSGPSSYKCVIDGRYLFDGIFSDLYNTFRAWQRIQSSTTSPSYGCISSAEEHHRFTDDEAQSTTTITSIISLTCVLFSSNGPVASECAHALHRRAAPEAFCPVCKVEHCLELLLAIKTAREKAGGSSRATSYRDSSSGIRVPAFEALKKGWRAARLELLKLVEKLEADVLAQDRSDLLVLSAAYVFPAPPLRDAKAALQKYHEACEFGEAFQFHEEKEVAITSESHRDVDSKPKKTVRFAEDIPEPSHRAKQSYKRRAKKYVAGNHKAPENFEADDTSFRKNGYYTLQQCKVCFTLDVNIRQRASERDKWPEFEGVAGLHASWDEIYRSIVMTLCKTPELARLKWWKDLEKPIDGIALVKADGKYIDCVFLHGSKKDAEETDASEETTI